MFLQSRRSDTDREVCKQRHKGTDTVSQKAHIYSSETHFLNHLASQRSRPWLQWSSRYFAGGQNSWLALSSSQIARASTSPICRGVEGKVFSKAKVDSLIGWGWCVQGLARCLRRMWTMQTQVNSKLLQTSYYNMAFFIVQSLTMVKVLFVLKTDINHVPNTIRILILTPLENQTSYVCFSWVLYSLFILQGWWTAF